MSKRIWRYSSSAKPYGSATRSSVRPSIDGSPSEPVDDLLGAADQVALEHHPAAAEDRGLRGPGVARLRRSREVVRALLGGGGRRGHDDPLDADDRRAGAGELGVVGVQVHPLRRLEARRGPRHRSGCRAAASVRGAPPRARTAPTRRRARPDRGAPRRAARCAGSGGRTACTAARRASACPSSASRNRSMSAYGSIGSSDRPSGASSSPCGEDVLIPTFTRPPGERVDGAEVLGEAERRLVAERHDVGLEPDRVGALAGRGQERERGGDARAPDAAAGCRRRRSRAARRRRTAAASLRARPGVGGRGGSPRG